MTGPSPFSPISPEDARVWRFRVQSPETDARRVTPGREDEEEEMIVKGWDSKAEKEEEKTLSQTC
jgi:hypothetical protein